LVSIHKREITAALQERGSGIRKNSNSVVSDYDGSSVCRIHESINLYDLAQSQKGKGVRHDWHVLRVEVVKTK